METNARELVWVANQCNQKSPRCKTAHAERRVPVTEQASGRRAIGGKTRDEAPLEVCRMISPCSTQKKRWPIRRAHTKTQRQHVIGGQKNNPARNRYTHTYWAIIGWQWVSSTEEPQHKATHAKRGISETVPDSGRRAAGGIPRPKAAVPATKRHWKFSDCVSVQRAKSQNSRK